MLKTKAPNSKQSGQWVVPQRITAESTTGFITIDFTRASCPSSTNTSHISNRAPETAEPGAPTVIVTGHPVSGYIKIRQRHRKK